MKTPDVLRKELQETIAKINGTMIYSSKTKRALIQKAIVATNNTIANQLIIEFANKCCK